MAIELAWVNDENNALHYQFPPNWTWDDFYRVKAEADALLDDCDHDVVLLFDMADTAKIPAGALTQGRNLLKRAHPRGKPIILIGTNRMIEALLNMVNRLNPGDKNLLLAVPTFDDALKLLAQLK